MLKQTTDTDIDLTDEWLDAIGEYLPKVDERGWLDDVSAIRSVDAATLDDDVFGEILGRYMSHEQEIWLLEDYPDSSPHTEGRLHTFLHELGHHRHYQIVFGDTGRFGLEEWKDHFDAVVEESSIKSSVDIEYVADYFADYHRREVVGSTARYEELNGPPLGESIVEPEVEWERQ